MSLNNDSVIIRFKRGTEAGWMAEDKGNNPVLAEGEPGYHKETKQLKIGDGITPWDNLPYITGDFSTLSELINSKAGKQNECNSEIFNDYENNRVGPNIFYGHVEGYKNYLTNKKYSVMNWDQSNDWDDLEVTLSAPTQGFPIALKIGDIFTAKMTGVIATGPDKGTPWGCNAQYEIQGVSSVNGGLVHLIAKAVSSIDQFHFNITNCDSVYFGLPNYSHIGGYCNATCDKATFVTGRYNQIVLNSAFSIGNGTAAVSGAEAQPEIRSNALTVDWAGNLNVMGTISNPGEDYAEYFEWADGNIDAEDRIGYIVTLAEDKIEKAQPGSDILGIISGTACVIGDEALYEWKQKYQTDEFGRVLTDMVEEFIEETDTEGNIIQISIGFFPHRRLNPNYDSNQIYIPRSKRPEWDTVGLLGKLHARDDGTCVVGGYATAGVDGIATYSAEKTNMRVLKRLSDNIILVFMK